MQVQVSIPIACCPGCFQGYTLAEWRRLQLHSEQPPNLERRVCPRCDAPITLDVDGLDDCDLTMDADFYEQIYPDSDRPRLARERAARGARAARRRLAISALAVLALAALTYVALLQL
jgi:hypothetical protein